MRELIILTSDARLGQVLAMQAELCGAQGIIKADAQGLSAAQWEQIRIALVDLDAKQSGTIPEHVRVLGLCRDPENLPLRARRMAHVLFRRPCRMAELRREISSVLQKEERPWPSALTAPTAQHGRNTLQLLHDSRCVLLGNTQISLSDKEFAVLSRLMQKGEEGLSKEELAALFKNGISNEGQVYICHLRKKLEHAFGVRLIKTVRNKGYVYVGDR